MTQIYACLCGQWINLCDDDTCIVGENGQNPVTWWEENADIFSPNTKTQEHTMYQQDYVNIHYKDADYRIHPIFIQIVKR